VLQRGEKPGGTRVPGPAESTKRTARDSSHAYSLGSVGAVVRWRSTRRSGTSQISGRDRFLCPDRDRGDRDSAPYLSGDAIGVRVAASP
jgi:hypothetical protein